MLSVKVLTRRNIDRAASYYEESFDDYYAKEGQWQGKGAEILKLSKIVDKTDLRRLLAGETGGYNTRSSTRRDQKERIGLDLTFSAPKSVSLQALVGSDARVIKAHEAAVRAALKVTEQQAQARQKIKGQSQTEATGNLIIAKFQHETSRAGDPQLHTHAIVMNLTQRRDGQWRALKNESILKMTRSLGTIYRAELAFNLQRLGYDIRYQRDDLFELAHFQPSHLRAFSKRSTQIEQQLQAEGLSRAVAPTRKKQRATIQSRRQKIATPRKALLNDWQARARQLGIDCQPYSKSRTGPELRALRQAAKALVAQQVIRSAIKQLRKRSAILSEPVIIAAAMTQGTSSLSGLKRELKQQVKKGYLVRGDLQYTSKVDERRSKTRDQWITELVSQGQSKTRARRMVSTAIKQNDLIRQVVSYTTIEDPKKAPALSKPVVSKVIKRSTKQRVRSPSSLAASRQPPLKIRKMTKAASRYSKHYHIGDTVEPQRDYLRTGLKKGEFYQIEAVGPSNHLTVKSDTGQRFKFSPLIHQQLLIYRPLNLEIRRDRLDTKRFIPREKEYN